MGKSAFDDREEHPLPRRLREELGASQQKLAISRKGCRSMRREGRVAAGPRGNDARPAEEATS